MSAKLKYLCLSLGLSLGFLLVRQGLEASPTILADDTELSGPPTQLLDFTGQIEWDEVSRSVIASGAEFQVLRRFNGQLTPVVGLPFVREETGQRYQTNEEGILRIPLCMEGATYLLRLETANEYFEIRASRQPYATQVNLRCFERTVAIVNEDSGTGQILGIWQIAFGALTKLSQVVGLDYWTQKIKFHWPADGDYYFYGGNVYISSGHHWDVVAHEMGHAVYDLANVGEWGGGQHYIDQCYSNALALSEGWASYFAAFVTQDRADPDAKFQHMVPRRAPIRVENVPEDVCREPTNEWRVMSFLWDLYDVNTDPELADFHFAEIWKVTTNGNFPSIRAIKEALLESGFDSSRIDQAWINNF